ncbi:hypothetical protein V1512DRAFT_257599 [Lipomyces arxii]|uniref:uncharacterized protein n=1 Tax=Lipomyces arxii TaxID=56418 RepID=UPI0034CEA895
MARLRKKYPPKQSLPQAFVAAQSTTLPAYTPPIPPKQQQPQQQRSPASSVLQPLLSHTSSGSSHSNSIYPGSVASGSSNEFYFNGPELESESSGSRTTIQKSGQGSIKRLAKDGSFTKPFLPALDSLLLHSSIPRSQSISTILSTSDTHDLDPDTRPRNKIHRLGSSSLLTLSSLSASSSSMGGPALPVISSLTNRHRNSDS